VQVNFPRRDETKLRIALEKTHTTRWAQKGQILGFARATSDANLTATIWDVSVHPAWQRQGAGRGLVERLVASLCSQGVSLICLYAEPHVVLLYERLGFQKDVKRMKGMGFATRSQAGQQMIAAAVQLQ
jgi:aralkylamine N-acetyltransferase